ncbi:hypothetical protein BJX61DRAFT_44419 [Aspergillus egyptiacus]|nr:hypothetical protein BJX61DRAFT_44419 [Aspergillus egyptiacus]
MSTQSPIPLTPKGPRNARRNQKKITTPSAQNASTLATPPSSPPGSATDSSAIPLSKKKGNRSAKKSRDVSRTSPVQKTADRRTSTSNNHVTTPQLKDARYAGPTFHASPAPSALPIPSFFSKSFPEPDLAPSLEPDSDSFDVDPDIANTPSKTKSRVLASQEECGSTPLDFLFKAAVEARTCQPQRSPDYSPVVGSPQTDSRADQQLRMFNNDTPGMFALEIGGSDLHRPQIGPSFAPSYKERMNALRSASSPSPKELDEDERRAKTEALKNLLLNPRPQRPSSVSHTTQKHVGHSQECPIHSPMVPHFATPLRTSSGPPIMSSRNDYLDQVPPHSRFEPQQAPHFHSPGHHRFLDSNRESGVLASHPGNAPSTPRQAYNSPSATYSSSKFSANHQNLTRHPHFYSNSPISRNAPTSSKSPALDTKKMEDDLRRILKLDANPGIPSNGIQTSLA